MTYTVLVVDDSKLARMAVARILRTLHPQWQLAEAANAAEALVKSAELSPQIVLVDFNMPGQDGVSLAAELRVRDPGVSVAVISANRQVAVVTRAEAAGASFLPKPLTESALAEFLDAVRREREPTPP